MTKMNPEVKELWLAALRSGEYTQAKGYLCQVDTKTRKRGHCCLGVLSELAVKADVIEEPVVSQCGGYLIYNGNSGVLSEDVMNWAGLNINGAYGPVDDDGCVRYTLAELNDSGATFAKIAETIEREF